MTAHELWEVRPEALGLMAAVGGSAQGRLRRHAFGLDFMGFA